MSIASLHELTNKRHDAASDTLSSILLRMSKIEDSITEVSRKLQPIAVQESHDALTHTITEGFAHVSTNVIGSALMLRKELEDSHRALLKLISLLASQQESGASGEGAGSGVSQPSEPAVVPLADVEPSASLPTADAETVPIDAVAPDEVGSPLMEGAVPLPDMTEPPKVAPPVSIRSRGRGRRV